MGDFIWSWSARKVVFLQFNNQRGAISVQSISCILDISPPISQRIQTKNRALSCQKRTSCSPYSLLTSMFMPPTYTEKVAVSNWNSFIVYDKQGNLLFSGDFWESITVQRMRVRRKHFPKSQFLFSCLSLALCKQGGGKEQRWETIMTGLQSAFVPPQKCSWDLTKCLESAKHPSLLRSCWFVLDVHINSSSSNNRFLPGTFSHFKHMSDKKLNLTTQLLSK